MARKQTVGEKREARVAIQAEAKKKTVKGAATDRISLFIKEANGLLGGQGRIFRGSEIEQQSYARRSSGVPSVDYILNGGYPRGGLVEIGGEYSTGKTTLTLKGCAEEQRTGKGAIFWGALEPFSKRWARENEFFLPFCEDLVYDQESNTYVPSDPYEKASELELLRMEQAGITDPYANVSEFVLVEDQRGDVLLDVARKAVESNSFAIVVVDSLGVAKSTKWVEEGDVQSHGDFSREPKMIGDYTTRCLLALNKRYDASGNPCNDGEYHNQTTVIHLNQIVTAIGTNARAKHKTQTIKGGEANKHNHHAIIFLSKGEELGVEVPGRGYQQYGREVRAIGLKSKIGPPLRTGSWDFYFNAFDTFQPGDIDIVKDGVALALISKTIQQAGAHYEYCGEKFHGRANMETFFRENPEWFIHLRDATTIALRT
jgi:RecA/RadA recombinase